MTNLRKGELLSRMLLLAVQGHKDQFDKGGRPYILHPLAVMHKLRTDDEELQCMAVGHDLVEDGKINGVRITYERLRVEGFTPRIIEGIRCLTRVPGETEEEYQDKVISNLDACKCKKGDLEHNGDFRRLKGIGEKDMARIAKYARFHARIVARLDEHHVEREAVLAQAMAQRSTPVQEQQT